MDKNDRTPGEEIGEELIKEMIEDGMSFELIYDVAFAMVDMVENERLLRDLESNEISLEDWEPDETH